MKFGSFSVVTGTEACNAKCPYCVSRMTPKQKLGPINWRNFNIACKRAVRSDIDTVLLTGKGEPVLYPDHITNYLFNLEKHNFPFIELQTNGILLQEREMKSHLKTWYQMGLTTISISVAHYNTEQNRAIIGSNFDPIGLASLLQNMGFLVRFSCVMMKGGIDSTESVKNFIRILSTLDKQVQLTLRPVTNAVDTSNTEISRWIQNNQPQNLGKIKTMLDVEGHRLLLLPHGGIVYDYEGQNICLTNCLTEDLNPDNIRQLIYYPSGRLTYDWQYKGAILL